MSGPELAAGTVLAGRYHLRGPLGRGGAGAVWHADDEILDRPVAVKLLHPELERDEGAVARFHREATAAAALTHPNAVIIYDIGEDGGRVFLVMELVDGLTLSTVLEARRLAPAQTAAVGCAVARALGAAHARSLVHRDVKPGNILLTREGVAKVTDFGIATALGDAQTRLTVPGTIVGTSAYLSPEQLDGGDVDGRADVYALGLVLHEALTGRRTFAGGTAVEVAARRLAGDVPPPSREVDGVPEELDLAIERATRRDPDERFEDGAEMAVAIANLVEDDAAPGLARLVEDLEAASPARATPELTPALSQEAAPEQATTRVARAAAPTEADATTALGPAHGPAAGSNTSRTAALRPSDAPAPAPAPSPPPDAPAPAAGGSRRRGPLLLVAGLVFLVLLVFAVLDVLDGGEGGPGGGEGGDLEALPVAGSDAYDPFGTSPEHPEDAPNSHDGDPETTWQTQRYNSAALGGLKPGVGLWLDLGEAADVAEITLALQPQGADLEIYAAHAPPPADVADGWSPDEWGALVADVQGAGTDETLELEDVEAQVFLLWFTSLPDDGGGHRVHVGEVGFHG